MKIYVIGPAKSYAGWMESDLTDDINKADLVWLTGGEDINPKIYGEEKGARTHFSAQRDEYEIKYLQRAYTLGKSVFGTCRGAQLLCGMAGGKLVQHLAHPSHHPITFWDGSKIETTSCHHQLQHPYSISRNEYEVLAWAEGLSKIHLNGVDEQMALPTIPDSNTIMEAELVYYKRFKALGIQGHPEWMSHNTKLVKVLKVMTEQLVKGDLEAILFLKLSTEKLLSEGFELSDDERQFYNEKMAERKKEPMLIQ